MNFILTCVAFVLAFVSPNTKDVLGGDEQGGAQDDLIDGNGGDDGALAGELTSKVRLPLETEFQQRPAEKWDRMEDEACVRMRQWTAS